MEAVKNVHGVHRFESSHFGLTFGQRYTYEDKKVEEKKEVFDGIRHTALHVVPSK